MQTRMAFGPNRLAVSRCHDASPNEAPCSTDRPVARGQDIRCTSRPCRFLFLLHGEESPHDFKLIFLDPDVCLRIAAVDKPVVHD